MADDPTDPADADEAAAEEADVTDSDDVADAPASGTDREPSPASTEKDRAVPSAKAATGGAGAAAKPVVRKKVASKRVTPKGGPVKGGPVKGAATPGSTAARAHSPGGHDAPESARYTPPSAKYDQLPSPMWVPILMFALLIIGAVVIVGNYARLFGDPSNVYLVAGLACILGGIITATNYR